MPRYGYECPACEWTGDLFAAVDERNNQSCPECLTPLIKLFSPPTAKARIGARNRVREMKARGLVDLGDYDSYRNQVDDMRRRRERTEDEMAAESERAILKGIEDEGGIDNFLSRDPSEIRRAREEAARENAEEPLEPLPPLITPEAAA